MGAVRAYGRDAREDVSRVPEMTVGAASALLRAEIGRLGRAISLIPAPSRSDRALARFPHRAEEFRGEAVDRLVEMRQPGVNAWHAAMRAEPPEFMFSDALSMGASYRSRARDHREVLAAAKARVDRESVEYGLDTELGRDMCAALRDAAETRRLALIERLGMQGQLDDASGALAAVDGAHKADRVRLSGTSPEEIMAAFREQAGELQVRGRALVWLDALESLGVGTGRLGSAPTGEAVAGLLHAALSRIPGVHRAALEAIAERRAPLPAGASGLDIHQATSAVIGFRRQGYGTEQIVAFVAEAVAAAAPEPEATRPSVGMRC